MALNLAMKMLAAGTAVAVGGALSGAKAQRKMHESNAEQARVEATWRRKEAQQNLEDHRRSFYRFQGRNRVVYGKGGVKFTSGTPMDVLAENEQLSLLDESRIKELGEHEATGFEKQAEMDRMKAKYATRKGWYDTASLLTSAGSSAIAMQ
tara:strand:+ start:206 stop:658 length:453 start_codon:yes stop_codon:yes gene_type:complete